MSKIIDKTKIRIRTRTRTRTVKQRTRTRTIIKSSCSFLLKFHLQQYIIFFVISILSLPPIKVAFSIQAFRISKVMKVTRRQILISNKKNSNVIIPMCYEPWFVWSVYCSESSKWASPPIGLVVGKYACANTPFGPSKGLPSPCSPSAKSMRKSAFVAELSSNVSVETSDHTCKP